MNKQIRIYCIGDSNTQGRAGESGCPPVLSYRYPLFKLLVDSGVEFSFVGGNEGGFGGAPAYGAYCGREFENVHEAYWGWNSGEVADRVVVHARDVEPDVAIVMVGANDEVEAYGVGPSVEALGLICEDLRIANPQVRIVFVLPFSDGLAPLAEAQRGLAAELSSVESPVLTVETFEGWVGDPEAPGSCTHDGVHTNERGDGLIACAVFDALRLLELAP